MYVIGRYINGIILNDLEYMLEDNGEIKKFKTRKKAKAFLKKSGYTDEDIHWLTIVKVKGENRVHSTNHTV